MSQPQVYTRRKLLAIFRDSREFTRFLRPRCAARGCISCLTRLHLVPRGVKMPLVAIQGREWVFWYDQKGAQKKRIL